MQQHSATISSAQSASPSDLTADVIIVGSGATGQAVARRLSAAGVDVLMLEAGGMEPVHRKNQELFQAAMPPVYGQYPDFGTHLLMTLGGSIGKPVMPLSSDGSAPEEGIRLTRLTDADFASWPISMADLAPYYEAVEALFGIEHDSDSLPIFDDERLKAHRFDVVSRKEFSHPTEESLGNIRVLVDAPVQRLYVNASGAVSGLDIATSDGQTLRCTAATVVLAMNTMPATQLLLHSGIGNSSEMIGRHLMDHPLITLGFVEPSTSSPHDLISQLTPQPNGNSLIWPKLISDQELVEVGGGVNLAMSLVPSDWSIKRNLLRHRLLKPVVVGARTGARHSAERSVRALREKRFDAHLARDLYRSARGLDELLHIKFRPPGPRYNLEKGWWADEYRSSVPKTYEIVAMTEQRPHPANRVRQVDEQNSLGWRKLRAEWHYGSIDRDRSEAAADPILRALDESGIGTIERLGPKRHVENYSCHHASGTLRMSDDPTQGVVDAHSRSHDHHNLYIAGMSTFPSVGFANPTLTSMALGVRIADTILTRRKAATAPPTARPQPEPARPSSTTSDDVSRSF